MSSPRATGDGNGGVFPDGQAWEGSTLFCAWWYFAPDYAGFLATPLAELTISDIMWHIFWLLLLVRWLFATISWLYEAWTGRDSVWLWHHYCPVKC
jgi:hypothetical protein